MQCFSINGVMGINVVVAESIFFLNLSSSILIAVSVVVLILGVCTKETGP